MRSLQVTNARRSSLHWNRMCGRLCRNLNVALRAAVIFAGIATSSGAGAVEAPRASPEPSAGADRIERTRSGTRTRVLGLCLVFLDSFVI